MRISLSLSVAGNCRTDGRISVSVITLCSLFNKDAVSIGKFFLLYFLKQHCNFIKTKKQNQENNPVLPKLNLCSIPFTLTGFWIYLAGNSQG